MVLAESRLVLRMTNRFMRLIPLRTHLMVADALTKSLLGPALTQHREVMLGHTPFFARLLHYPFMFITI